MKPASHDTSREAADPQVAGQQDSGQAMQRVRVGMTGLATVLVVIGLASVIFSSANREQPVRAVGSPNANVVAGITDGNTIAEKNSGTLAELGVEPSTASTEQVNIAVVPITPAKQ